MANSLRREWKGQFGQGTSLAPKTEASYQGCPRAGGRERCIVWRSSSSSGVHVTFRLLSLVSELEKLEHVLGFDQTTTKQPELQRSIFLPILSSVMPLGFLLVTAEPGDKVTLDEFQEGTRDWYNNEHVPLRLNHLPSFLTGARFSAADGGTPSWLAVYDIDDTATFAHESYTRLRANRSPREANLVQRLAILDRRTYEVVADSGESTLTSSYKPENPTKHVVTQWLNLPADSESDKAFEAWSAAVFRALSGVEGWVRTRTYKCIDNLKTGLRIPAGPEAQIVPKYLAVHGTYLLIPFRSTHANAEGIEVLSLSVADLPGFVAGANPGSQATIEETRTWDLYRAYPCIAQGNLAA
ncbi:hypothetical protein HMN09_00548800 [Mycena chlorophos]|uniref:Uncharacterized protein n=1 Tax=Mycena chlorophos TaxID=658473 RepID=A0A8H6WDK0_MYCCL|nr:hypothetical protein HMN09_00548800 [Mycena chlorophos]